MKRRITDVQNISRMCFVCGRENSSGLSARFYNLEDGEVMGLFSPRESHQSYPGRLHGGVSSAILDETIGRALNVTDPDAWGVTVELTLRYRRPVPTDSEIRAFGRITKHSSRIYEGTGEIVLEDGTVAVEATGRYLRQPIERIADGDFAREWFIDEREAPEEVDR